MDSTLKRIGKSNLYTHTVTVVEEKKDYTALLKKMTNGSYVIVKSYAASVGSKIESAGVP